MPPVGSSPGFPSARTTSFSSTGSQAARPDADHRRNEPASDPDRIDAAPSARSARAAPGSALQQEPDVLLGRTAEILAESLGFRAVVAHLYRPRCDAFQVVAAHGSDEVRERLLDSTTTLDAWTPLLDDRFEHGGVSFIPHGELGRSVLGTVNVPATGDVLLAR